MYKKIVMRTPHHHRSYALNNLFNSFYFDTAVLVAFSGNIIVRSKISYYKVYSVSDNFRSFGEYRIIPFTAALPVR